MLDHLMDLPQAVDHVAKKNILDTYWPTRKKDNDFDWEETSGFVLGLLLHKQLSKQYSRDKFKEDCHNIFTEKLVDEPNFWDILEKMYFTGDVLSNIAPEFNLLKTQYGKIERKNKRLGSIFQNFVCYAELANEPITFASHLNFVEKEIHSVMIKNLTDVKPVCNDRAYLPFLANSFTNDVRFLESYPSYFLSELTNLLKLYSFLYCTQLALNIREWQVGEPVDKPLYFLLESEKASQERTWIKTNGFYFFENATKWVFPLLSMLENLNKTSRIKYPLWWYGATLETLPESEKDAVGKKLFHFAQAFKGKRDLQTQIPNTSDPLKLIKTLTKLAYEQFDETLPFDRIKQDYVGVNSLNRQAIIKEICSDFIVSRGRAGRILVINQDYLILLTNLVIGKEEKLRFYELLAGYRSRGVYFDKQSEVALVNFFERLGNVERLSDSGEAVYVYKTI